ncbi:MAG: PKD domain-containing protein [Bacteroidota bacterium]
MKINTMGMYLVGLLLLMSHWLSAAPPCTSYPSPVIQSDFLSTCQDKGERPGQGQNDCVLACEDATIDYFTQNNTGSTYSWTVAGAASYTASGNTVSVTWGNVGTGLVQVTETNADGCSTTTSICIEIIEKPTAGFTSVPQAVGNVITICIGADIVFTDNSSNDVVTWLWDFDDNTQSNDPNPIKTYTTPGTYDVELVVFNDCGCSDTTNVTVIVNSSDAPQITCLSTQCTFDRVSYSVPNACPGATYTWTVISGGTLVSSPNDPVATVVWDSPVNGQGVLQVLVTGCSVCPIPTQVVIPIISDALSITGPQRPCVGDIVEYSVPPQPGNSYSWVVTGGGFILTPGPGLSTIEVNWFSAGPGNVSVDITNGDLGCDIAYPTFNLPIDVLNPFEMTDPTTQEICFSPADNATYTLSPTVTGGTVQWTAIPSGGGAPITLPGGTNSSVTVAGNFLAPGFYEIRATTNSTDFCNAEVSGILTVVPAAPQPLASALSGPLTVCPGSCYEYTATPDNGYYIQWSVSGGEANGVSGNTTASGDNITICWDNSGSYQIDFSQAAIVEPECPSIPQSITVNPLNPSPPAIQHPSSASTFCSDVITSFSVAPVPQATNYYWYFQNDLVGSVISGQSSTNIDVQMNYFTSTITTNLVLETTVCGQVLTSTYSVTIDAAPTANITINPDPACQSLPGSLNPSTFTGTLSSTPSGTSSVSWTWEFGDGGTGTGSTTSHNYFNFGTFLVKARATIIGGVCDMQVVETTYLLDVKPAPLVNITANNGFVLCPPQTPNTTLFASVQPLPGGGVGNYSYSWTNLTFGGGSTNTSFLVTQPNSTIELVVTDNATGCETRRQVRVRQCSGPNPCAGITGIDFDVQASAFCNQFTFTEDITIPFVPGTIRWDFDDGNSGAGSPVTHTYEHSGFYNVTMSVELPGGLVCSWTETVTVIFVPYFITEYSCVGGNIVTDLIDQTDFLDLPGVNLNYSWSLPAGSTYVGGSGPNDPSPQAIIPFGTSQTITLTVTDGSTTCQTTQTLNIPAPASANFTASPTCEGIPVDFINSSTGIGNSYLWSFGDGAESTLTAPDREYNNLPGGGGSSVIFPVTLSVTDQFGCTDTDMLNLTIYRNTIANLEIDPAGPFCANAGTALNATFAGGTMPYTYSWGTVDNMPFATGNPSSNVVTSTNGYIVTVTDANGCASISDVENVVVQPVPNAIVFGRDEYCLGDEVLLSGNQGSDFTYQWSANYPFGTSNATTPSITFTPFGSGSFNAVVTLTDIATGCFDASPVFTGTINDGPQGLNITPTSGCVPIALTANASSPVSNYVWSNGTAGSNMTTALSGGTIEVVAYAPNGCQSSASVNLDEAPDLSDLAVGCYCFPDHTTWTAPQGWGYTYQWFLDGNPITGATMGTYTFTQSGIYNVLVTNQAGCSTYSEDIIIDIGDNCRDCGLEIDPLKVECIGFDLINGGPLYEITVAVFNNGISLSNFSATSNEGIVHAATFQPNSIPGGGSGPTTVTFEFTLLNGSSFACFVFAGTGTNGVLCEFELCIDGFPPCDGGGGFCEIEPQDYGIECLYNYNGFNFYNFQYAILNNGNPLINLSWVDVNGNPDITIAASPNNLPGGGTTSIISGTIIAPQGTGSVTFLVTGYDPVTREPCKFEITFELPECENEFYPCDQANAKSPTLTCASPFVDIAGNYNYNLSVTITSVIANGSVVVSPVQGQWENNITNLSVITSGNTYTINAQVVDVPPHNSPLCFEVYIAIGHDVCIAKFCVRKPRCSTSDAQGRSLELTDIEKLSNNSSLTANPNPASTAINIAYELDKEGIIELRLIRMDGQLVRHLTHLRQELNMPLDISDLPDGVYSLLLFRDGQLEGSQKVVKISN